MIVNRTALVEQPAHHVFDLIEAAEHYPQFLPWCASTRIVERGEAFVSADIQFRWEGVSFEWRTRHAKQRPETLAIHLERGPFSRFQGEWRLGALGEQTCRLALLLDYEFASGTLAQTAGPVFDRVANSLVDAFVLRAQAVPWK